MAKLARSAANRYAKDGWVAAVKSSDFLLVRYSFVPVSPNTYYLPNDHYNTQR